MSLQVQFLNGLGSPIYSTVYYTCPIPNRFTPLAMVVSPRAYPNTTVSFRLPQTPYSFTWAKYDPKNKGIFTQDNQVNCMLRIDNIITFSNHGGPHFLNQTSFPIDEFNIKVDAVVRNNAFLGGLCMGGYPVFAQIMQSGDTQRYPSQLNLTLGYSLEPITQGQFIVPSLIKSIDLSEYQGSGSVYVYLDRDGQLHASAQAMTETGAPVM